MNELAELDYGDLPPLATYKQAADWANTTIRHLQGQIKEGKFPPPIYVGVCSPRFRRSDLIAWLESLAATTSVRLDV